MKNRDLEFLSAYLDGQLNPNESARLESRIASNPEMKSALADLRAARNVLRKLPQRKAPRNFTLTRKMVGLNPPLPRSYSFFRFATAFASLLLVLTFAANILAPRLSYVGPINGGFGGGGGYGGGIGGGPAIQQSAPEAMADSAMEEPATEAAEPQELAPSAAEAPAEKMVPSPTETVSAGEGAAAPMMEPTAEVAMEKPVEEEMSAPQDQTQVEKAALIPVGWQIAFLVSALIAATVMVTLRQSAKRKWR